MYQIILMNSLNPKKKFTVFIENNGNIKRVDFGLKGASDFTIHKNFQRRNLYIQRHSGMGENWGKSGVYTPGWWSRWLLWGDKPNFKDAIKDIEKKINAKIDII